MEAKIGFVSFAAGNRSVKLAGIRLKNQLLKSKIPAKIKIYGENDLATILAPDDEAFLSQNMCKRGFGFWIWKPLIIIDFLEKNPELDFLVYLDAGCEFHISDQSLGNFYKYVEGAKLNQICSFSTQNDQKYTKCWTLNYFQLNEQLILMPQIQSGILIFNSSAVNPICLDWIELMRVRNYENLVDKRDKLLEHPEFIEHRHDQSILSMYLKSKNIGKIYPASEHTWPHHLNDSLKMSPFWAVRNMSLVSVRYQHFWNPFYILERFLFNLNSKFHDLQKN